MAANIAKEPTIEEKIAKSSGEIVTRYYKKGRFLGKGGFARVYEFTSSETRKTYAAKIVSKSALLKSRAKQKLMSEIKIHRSLHHGHIVGFEHFFEDAENVYILLELCQNQTMSELLRRRKRLTELEVQCYFSQIIPAVQYLHSKKIVHRDLKIGNIFINQKMEVKLGDFGLACKIEFDGQKRKTVCGTPNYIAPEVLEGKAGHSYEVDCWSIGVIMYTLLVGKPPFETNDIKKTYNLIKKNAYSFPENIGLSSEARALITRILKSDPNKRPGLKEILAHDFFHIGKSIPRLLPVSTLAVPPSESFAGQFMPRSKNVAHVPSTETLPIKQQKLAPRQKTQSQRLKMEDYVPGISSANMWVRKWVDYSNKYGMGYVLSNGHVGVHFNDSSKMIVAPNASKFFYIDVVAENKECAKQYEFSQYPKSLYKKVTLFQHFKSYLETELETIVIDENEYRPDTPPVYVKKWIRTKRAILFRFSNKVIQVIFQDHTEIIIFGESRFVTYIGKKRQRTSLPLDEAMESTNRDMTKRLKYTKEILNQLMSEK